MCEDLIGLIAVEAPYAATILSTIKDIFVLVTSSLVTVMGRHMTAFLKWLVI